MHNQLTTGFRFEIIMENPGPAMTRMGVCSSMAKPTVTADTPMLYSRRMGLIRRSRVHTTRVA
jgi:hypothetical protein